MAMADAVISNVRKNTDGDITDVGVKGRWEWPVPQVISSIENRTNTFYVQLPQRADVYVAKTPAGRKFPQDDSRHDDEEQLGQMS